jgi:hypothetical protein
VFPFILKIAFDTLSSTNWLALVMAPQIAVTCPASKYFSTLFHKRHDFQKRNKKKIIGQKTGVLIFCTNRL